MSRRKTSPTVHEGFRLPTALHEAIMSAASAGNISKTAIVVGWLQDRAEAEGYMEPAQESA